MTIMVALPLFSILSIAGESTPPVPEKAITTSVLALFGTPKYPENFTHFDYVNPNAPKGGMITLARKGTFDNFNRSAQRGVPAAMTGELFDPLFISPDDEIGIYYPLIAKSITYSSHYRWAIVELNPAARFYDNHPITAEDVEFTFNKFMTQGVPQYRSYYKDVSVKVLDPYHVRIDFAHSDKELLIGFVSGMRVLPKHFWQNKDLSQPLSTPPLGSSAYFVAEYKMGQYVIYQRNDQYWAKDLPVNKGRYNFDKIRYTYFLDDNVALEAFKAGTYDLRDETLPKTWLTQYNGPNFEKGNIIKMERPVESSPNTIWLAFNTTRSLFSDCRIRYAISLAFDFDWQNRALYYSSYQRVRSYFPNTLYEASMLPDQDELAWLTPLVKQIPEQVFTQIYQPPHSDASGFNRNNLLKAAELLKEAGWVLKKGKLYHSKTGQPFEFELSLRINSYAPYVLSFQQNLARLGINMKVNVSDVTRLTYQLRNRDFDMMPTYYYSFDFPSNGLKTFWGSDYVNSSWNTTGYTSPAVDTLLENISRNQHDPKALLALGRALDRILTWNMVMIPTGYLHNNYYAYWNKFSFPEKHPPYALGLSTWWFTANQPQPSQNRTQ